MSAPIRPARIAARYARSHRPSNARRARCSRGKMRAVHVRRIVATVASLIVVAGLVASSIARPPRRRRRPSGSRRRATWCARVPRRTDCRYIRPRLLPIRQGGQPGVAKGGYDRFLTLGDLQYYFGAYADFQRWYTLTYGKVMPGAGNHESYTVGCEGKPLRGVSAVLRRAGARTSAAARTLGTDLARGTSCR